MERRLLGACSWHIEISQISTEALNIATVDAHWVCYIYTLTKSLYTSMYRHSKYIYISAWASALLVQSSVGNARASMCGTSNSTDSRAFLYMHINPE